MDRDLSMLQLKGGWSKKVLWAQAFYFSGDIFYIHCHCLCERIKVGRWL